MIPLSAAPQNQMIPITFERRFRWTVHQVLAAVEETQRALNAGGRPARAADRARRELLTKRLGVLGRFFSLIDAGIGAFARGEAFPAHKLAEVVPLRRSDAS